MFRARGGKLPMASPSGCADDAGLSAIVSRYFESLCEAPSAARIRPGASVEFELQPLLVLVAAITLELFVQALMGCIRWLGGLFVPQATFVLQLLALQAALRVPLLLHEPLQLQLLYRVQGSELLLILLLLALELELLRLVQTLQAGRIIACQCRLEKKQTCEYQSEYDSTGGVCDSAFVHRTSCNSDTHAATANVTFYHIPTAMR